MEIRNTRTYIISVGSILALAVVIRLVCYVGIIGSDDMNYNRSAYAIATGAFAPEQSHQATRIGLFLPVALMFKVFGVNEFSSTTFALVYFLMTFGVLASVVTVYLGRWEGIMAGLLYTFLPLEIFNASMFLPDLPSAACTGLSGALVYLVDGRRDYQNSLPGSRNQRISVTGNVGMFLAGITLGWGYLIRETSLFFGVFVMGYMVFRVVKDKRVRWTWIWFWVGFSLMIGAELGYYFWNFGTPFYRYLSVKGGFAPDYMESLSRHFGGMPLWKYLLLDRFRVLFDAQEFGFYYYFVFAGVVYGVSKRLTQMWYFISWFLTLFVLFSVASVSLSSYIPLRSVPRYYLAFSVPGIIIIATYLQKTAQVLRVQHRRELHPFLLSLVIPWILVGIITIRWFSLVRVAFLLGMLLFGGLLFFDRSRVWLRNRIPQHAVQLVVPLIFLYILLLPGMYMAAKGERPRKGITCEREVYRLLESPLRHTIYTDSRTESILEYFYQYHYDEQILQFADTDASTLENTYVIANWERIFFLNRVYNTPIPDFLAHPAPEWILRAQIGGEVNPCLIYEVPGEDSHERRSQ